jgi:hypothetical protein
LWEPPGLIDRIDKKKLVRQPRFQGCTQISEVVEVSPGASYELGGRPAKWERPKTPGPKPQKKGGGELRPTWSEVLVRAGGR